MCVKVEIPGLKVVSAANLREHWRTRSRRHAAEKLAVLAPLLSLPQHVAESVCVPGCPLRVRLTRVGKRLLDDDNLAGGFKAIRDAVAKWLGRDDGPRDGIAWEYRQEVGKGYAVRIEIEAVKEGGQ